MTWSPAALLRCDLEKLEMIVEWSLGQVEQVMDGSGTLRTWGFEILDKKHRALLLFSYASELEALIARRLVLIALEKAEFVGAPDR